MLKALIFDFDGTIVDSNGATVSYLKETFKHFNLPVPADQEFASLFGYKIPDVLKTLLPHLSEIEIQPIFEYSRIMSRKATPHIILITNALQTLKKLKKNYKIALVTTRSTESLQLLIHLHQIQEYFEVVIAREDVINHKPHPEGILKAIHALDVQPNETIYIGDARVDVETAHNANISCVIISPEDNDFGANYHVKEINQLPQLIAKVNIPHS